MGAISATDIISIIQSEIENFNWDEASRETGNVIWVGDGIATVYGIDHAMYGEIVVFDNGVKGMVQKGIVVPAPVWQDESDQLFPPVYHVCLLLLCSSKE